MAKITITIEDDENDEVIVEMSGHEIKEDAEELTNAQALAYQAIGFIESLIETSDDMLEIPGDSAQWH